MIMNTDRIHPTGIWFQGRIFRDEPILRKAPQESTPLPVMLRTARSLENSHGNTWQSRESIFLKQGKLLSNYEDDYPFSGNVVRYFPTYQALTDAELRGYFTWRTNWRQGKAAKTALSFAFLYIYELLNQIGVSDPLDGYHKLIAFRDCYGKLDDGVLPYLSKWLTDYVVYYELDPHLLACSREVQFDRSITVLDLICEQEDAKVMYALKQLAPKWLSRSKFYAAYQADCDAVIVQVLRKISDHYATRTKKTMVEQFFGKCSEYQTRLFDAAVFCDPLKKRNCEYALDERRIYRCKNGLWTITKHTAPLRSNAKLEDILKTIDAVMREEFSYKHPIKYETDTKWMIKIIREETQGFLAQKKAQEARKITIDYSQLSRIRQEAAVTQEKLTVDEDTEEQAILEQIAESPQKAPEPSQTQKPSEDCPLTATEYRLLRCLLYEESTSWVQSEGHLLSVLVDGINEKLYDTFMDSVLDDSPSLIEDYIDDLKEMVKQ